MTKISNAGLVLINILVLILFLPVLFSVIVFGANMDYYSSYKLPTLLPNSVLFLLCLLALLAWTTVFFLCRKIKLDRKQNLIMSVILLVLFVILYFVNTDIAKNIAYYTGWDPDCVSGYAYLMAKGTPAGTDTYLIIYPNNVPISYILGKLYMKALELKNYAYNAEFIWIQAGCLLFSVAGLAACLAVKKVTGNFITTISAFLLYVAVIGMTPWKIIPYTDSFAIAFPILSICFYVYYRDAQKKIPKLLFLFFAYASGVAGGLVKPTVYVVLIAVLIVEVLDFLRRYREAWKYLIAQIAFLIILTGISGAYQNKMVEEIGLVENPEISATWHHYFYMGLNEKTTGGYNSDDAAMFGEFQFRPVRERNAAEIERAFDRIRERGPVGTANFWLRKMVMTFNDGTFGWGISEAYFAKAYAPIADNNGKTEMLRNLFWPNSLYSGRYNTFCQLMWLFCLLGVPGICLYDRENRGKTAVFALCFAGVFLYLMLFESRARYLICFVPVILVTSLIGMQRYALLIMRLLDRIWKERKDNGRRKEDASQGVH